MAVTCDDRAGRHRYVLPAISKFGRNEQWLDDQSAEDNLDIALTCEELQSADRSDAVAHRE